MNMEALVEMAEHKIRFLVAFWVKHIGYNMIAIMEVVIVCYCGGVNMLKQSYHSILTSSLLDLYLQPVSPFPVC